MNRPNIAKRNVRTIERLIDEDGQTWPPELLTLAQECLLALKMVPGQEHLLKLPAFAACVLPAVEKFHKAHQAFKAKARFTVIDGGKMRSAFIAREGI